MREVEGETYLLLSEIKDSYKWGSSTLYLFRSMGLVETYKFVGDKRSYWKVSELEAVKNRPPEVTKRGPKSHALSKPIQRRTGRARLLVAVGVPAPAAASLV